jgi:hypothetical protein
LFAVVCVSLSKLLQAADLIFNNSGIYLHRPTTQAVRCWLFTVELGVQPLVTLCEIDGGGSDNGRGLSLNFFCFTATVIIPRLLHTYLPWPPEIFTLRDHRAHCHQVSDFISAMPPISRKNKTP